MWNPYQISESSSNIYAKSNTPDSSSSSGSSSTNSSTSEKMVNNHQPLSIASLIPTPSYDEEDQETAQSDSSPTDQPTQTQNEEQYLINQNHHQLQQQQHQIFHQQNMINQHHHLISNGRSSLGGSSDNTSSDLSSISATSTPTYRSPPSSFVPNPIYASQSSAPYNHLYSHQMQQNYSQFNPHFGGLDFGINNPYYANGAPSTQIPDQLKISSLVKQEFDYPHSQQRYNNNGEKLTSPPIPAPPQTTTPPSSLSTSSSSSSSSLTPLGNNQFNHHPNHQNPYSVYYNNMNLAAMNSYNQQYNSLPTQQTSLQLPPPPPPQQRMNQEITLQTQPKQIVRTPSPPNQQFHMAPASSSHSLTANLVPMFNQNLKIKMQDMPLWREFCRNGTEMIITKTGRRMFPTLRISIGGLESTKKYHMVIDIVPMDDNRYKYHNCEWIVSGKAEAHFGGRGYLHPDSPLTGSQWMKQVISFHKLKLTNNPFDKNGHIILNSMHKYIPRLHIINEDEKTVHTHLFHESSFIAVTAYQNESITKLKIEHNPFAKGFRDGQSRKDYRAKRGSDDENSFDGSNSNPPFSKFTKSSSNLNNENLQHIHQQQQQQSTNILANKDLNANKFNHMNLTSNNHGYQPTNNYLNMNENILKGANLLYDY
jgi:hypothetical protein